MIKWLYFLLLSALSVQVFAQDKLLLDSLNQVYQQQPSDSIKSLLLFQLSREYRHTYPDTALKLANQGLKLSQKINYKPGIAANLNSLGIIELNQGNYTLALKHLLAGLSINEALGDLLEIATNKNNLGEVYRLQQNYPEALHYYQEALKTNERVKNQKGIAINLNNIGEIYKEQNKLELALSYLSKSLIICEKLKDTRRIAVRLNNLGEVFAKKGEDEKAMAYFMKAQHLNDSLNNQVYIAIVATNLAKLETKNKNWEKGLKYAQRAFSVASGIRAKKECKDAAEVLAILFEKQGNYTLAFYNYRLFTQYKDSINAEEATRQMKEMQYEYTLVKQQKEILQLENDRKLQVQQQQTQKFYTIAFAIGILLLILLAVLQFSKSNFEHKAKEILQEKNKALENTLLLVDQQKQEITSQYEELHQQQEEIFAQRDVLEINQKVLESKNNFIQSSIQAAEVIQKAILPFDARVKKFLSDYYIIYQPKDIVSGDFYWIDQLDGKVILLVADCTGHGVPGAFMSLISNNIIEKIILADKNSDPAIILSQLHLQVRMALNQEETKNNNGLDVGIVILEKQTENVQKITFAGAKRPLYYISADNTQEMKIIKGTRKSIGGIQNENIPFENQVIILPQNSMIYLSSDGLIDQNDVKRTRLGSKRVFEALLSSFSLSLEVQKQSLLDLLELQLQNTSQRDDILWLGVRI